tara:strand:+ start:64 stop:972 length:909 start_codon:yes stop_codon:yes gene_type:complete
MVGLEAQESGDSPRGNTTPRGIATSGGSTTPRGNNPTLEEKNKDSSSTTGAITIARRPTFSSKREAILNKEDLLIGEVTSKNYIVVKGEVTSGTCPGLVEALFDESIPSHKTYTQEFLLTYQSFMSSHEFFDKMVDIYLKCNHGKAIEASKSQPNFPAWKAEKSKPAPHLGQLKQDMFSSNLRSDRLPSLGEARLLSPPTGVPKDDEEDMARARSPSPAKIGDREVMRASVKMNATEESGRKDRSSITLQYKQKQAAKSTNELGRNELPKEQKKVDRNIPIFCWITRISDALSTLSLVHVCT